MTLALRPGLISIRSGFFLEKDRFMKYGRPVKISGTGMHVPPKNCYQ